MILSPSYSRAAAHALIKDLERDLAMAAIIKLEIDILINKIDTLTENMEDIKVVVNSYLILGGYYGIRPRAETEMPKLAANARELIALLKEEYPES